VPIFTEEGKGYTLMEGYRVPPIMFTETEANALITAQQLVVNNRDASLVKEYTEAINKIKSVLRNKAKEKANLLSKRVLSGQNIYQDRSSNYLSTLQLALTNFHLVKIKYYSLDNQHSERIIEPFAMYTCEENWLLVAWCRLRKAYRTFRLDRIENVSVLNQTFTAHQITLEEYFEMGKKNI